MNEQKFWNAKLAARVHDPAEKALVLMRDPAGHEGGTTRNLFKTFFPTGIDNQTKHWIEKADHWASAADRPQFPQDANNRYAAWSQVRFDKAPEIKHPLTGKSAELGQLTIEPAHIKAFSTDSFIGLIERDAQGNIDSRKTLLSFWRFGADLNPKGLGALWRLLPADTRIPDHTIWAHLDLTSAFCGAFSLDKEEQPALLNMSFGPVQSFIASGRTTSDLWAGSHLLSRIAWEGMKVICERLGPDAIIFPQLRGVPLVDLWLQNEMGLDKDRFADCEWRKAKTDANPLFSAALPNKFVALVPADLAKELAEQVTEKVRLWVLSEAKLMLEKCLKIAGIDNKEDLYCYQQLQNQLDHFPEVYWASVPWLSKEQNGKVNTESLQQAIQAFYPVETDNEPQTKHFLASPLWQTLNQVIQPEQDWHFYKPNPGVLYPAIYSLVDRVATSAKSMRTFQQQPQQGYRNTLSGEFEWLSTDVNQLNIPPGQRQNTLWQKVAVQKPSWVKKGEHLSALDMLKRLWPSQFVEEIKDSIDELHGLNRYVVSTHTMAFSTSLEQWLNSTQRRPLPNALKAQLQGFDHRTGEQLALPKKIHNKIINDEDARLIAKTLLPFWEQYEELDDKNHQKTDIKEVIRKGLLEAGFLNKTNANLDQLFQENYYALILMDGDNMGAWLSGSEDKYRLAYQDSWHSKIKNSIDQRYREQLKPYLESKRYPSPARHMAIADALNGFSLDLSRYVVETLFKGKLLYAGGDDVMAMVAVDDLLPTMLLLRLVYSGIFPCNGDNDKVWRTLLKQEKAMLQLKNGYVQNANTLYRVMGDKATASCGAVIAHHTAPLGQVLKTLRSAEQRAKNLGGRNAFAIDLLKRSGGAIKLTCPWFNNPDNPESLLDSPIGQLVRLTDALAEPDMSRRAAYIAQDWLRQLPPESLFTSDPALYQSLLRQTLEEPLVRQNKGKSNYIDLADTLVKLGLKIENQHCTDFISQFIAIAEFLARDSRTGASK